MELLPTIVDALASGAACALATLGFVLVVNSIGAANLAHGNLIVFGWLVATALAGLLPDWPGLALLPFVAGLMALVGMLFCTLFLTPLQGRSAETIYIGTFCAAVMLATIAAAAGGGALPPRIALFGSNVPVLVFGTPYSRQSFAVIAIAIVLVPAIWLFLTSTQMGRRLRAAAQDPDLARALGIDTRRMIVATFALATALGGATSLFLAENLAAPGAGVDLLIRAYIAAVIAGWGRVATAAAMAVLLSLIDTLIARLIDPVVASAVLYGVLLAVALIRPEGVFGAPAQRRA